MVLFLVMQFVWKYIDDLVGRGVEWYYIAELLFYTCATVVPMALPLAILLSSIMTFGTLGEHNEMAAMKSSGLSLFRIMRPLLLFMIFLATAAFFFSNYVIPVANLKSQTLLKNITNKKPALNIREGVYYSGIDGYSIKVGEKYGENKEKLKNIAIYDHTERQGNLKVIVADTGLMQISPNELYLDITLYNGYSYEDMIASNPRDKKKHPFSKTSFSKSVISFNLSDFQSGDMRENKKKSYDMLNIFQIRKVVDSLDTGFDKRIEEFNSQMTSRYAFRVDSNNLDLTFNPSRLASMNTDILQNIQAKDRTIAVQNAIRIARSNKTFYESTELEFKYRHKIIARYLLEWQKKFSVSFSCLVLFLIGAPLGAIIRKGGMGMPVVISVFIFIVYHVTSYSFEKLGRELVWTPFIAIWLANLLLFPIGLWLTYKSANDSAIFNIEIYIKPFQNMLIKIKSRFSK